MDWEDVITFPLESKAVPFPFLSILIYLTLSSLLVEPQLGQKASFALFIPRGGKGFLEIQGYIRP